MFFCLMALLAASVMLLAYQPLYMVLDRSREPGRKHPPFIAWLDDWASRLLALIVGMITFAGVWYNLDDQPFELSIFAIPLWVWQTVGIDEFTSRAAIMASFPGITLFGVTSWAMWPSGKGLALILGLIIGAVVFLSTFAELFNNGWF